MSRLSDYLGDNILAYPEDVAMIKDKIPELALVPSTLVEKMYRDFSDTYCASWLILDEMYLENFKDWIRQ